MYQKNTKQRYSPATGLTTIEQVVAETIIQAIPERGISKETAEHFKIRTEKSQTTGQPIAHYFPYTKKGILTGFKKINLLVGKKHPDRFSTVGEVSIDCDLFGQSSIGNGYKVFVTEGEYDCACLFQSLKASRSNTRGACPTVVSIGLGTANAVTHMVNNTEYLNQHKQIVCIFDSDKATKEEAAEGIVKGQDAMFGVSLAFPQVLSVLLPVKDSCDLHRQDSEKLAELAIFSAKPFEPEDIVKHSLGVDVLMTPLVEGIRVACLPKTMDMMRGLRPGELTVVIAPAGVGKTTIMKEVGLALNLAGKKVGHILLEESVKKSQQSYIAMANNVPLAAFRENPNILSREAVERSNRQLIENGRCTWLSAPFGKIASHSILPRVRYMHSIGMEYIILDHIHLVISGEVMKDERQFIDWVLTECAAFCEATGVHLFLVAHITRQNRPPPKNREGNIAYPYWYEVKPSDGRGSGAFEQLSHNLWMIEPEILEDGERGRVRIKIGKNREWSWLGVADTLTQNHRTGRLVSI